MSSPAELVDRGIKAFQAGKMAEASAALEEALRLDPGNAAARSYLILVHGGGPSGFAPPARTPVPAPAARAADGPGGGGRPWGTSADELAPSPWDDGSAPAASIVLEPGSGLDLEAVAEKSDLRPLVPARARSSSDADARDVERWMQAARELFALGDFSGSLEIVEKALQVDPDHPEAREYLRQNEATLIGMCESKLGALCRIPRLALPPEQVMWLNLDHRAGFLLAQIDGTVSYEDLFALSGLPHLDTARILAKLLGDGVITS